MSRSGFQSEGVSLAIGVLIAVDAVTIGAVCAVKISPTAGVAIGLSALAAPVILGSLVLALINQFSGWSALARAYPLRPIADGAAGGLASSLSLRRRWMGYNMCVRWAADAECLHLSIIPLLGRMSRGMSIPWEELDFDESKPGDMVTCETTAAVRMWIPREVLAA